MLYFLLCLVLSPWVLPGFFTTGFVGTLSKFRYFHSQRHSDRISAKLTSRYLTQFSEELERVSKDFESSAIYSTDFIKHMMNHFKQQGTIPKSLAMKVLDDAIGIVKNDPNVIKLRMPMIGNMTICGDTHGQYLDLCKIFDDDLGGYPTEINRFVFNGDMVDRGPQAVEIVLLLCMMKVSSPNCVHMIKGNHETVQMNNNYGFKTEVCSKLDYEVLEKFRELFTVLPVAAVLEDYKVFIAHGGLGNLTSSITIEELDQLDRTVEPQYGTAIHELLWSDPREQIEGVAVNYGRGGGFVFGQSATESFLKKNSLSLLVRSHEVKMGGFAVQHDGLCVTVFSAPNYMGQCGNYGAFMRFNTQDDEMKPRIITYSAATPREAVLVSDSDDE